jgi:RND family efflux transporter MFP subunit
MRLIGHERARAAAHALSGALLLGGLALATACSAPPPPPPPVPAVTVAPALRAMVTPWSEFTGQFAAVQSVEVRPRVSGYIARVAFREGATVRTGDTLFLIEPRHYAALLAGAEAQLARAQGEVLLAKTELVRGETLFTARALAREELETRTNNLTQAKADVEAAQASVDTATLDLDWTVVRAPISGRASRAAVTPGNYVEIGASEAPLTTIVSQDPIYVYFNADEQTYLALVHEQTSPAETTSRSGTVAIGLADETGFPHPARIDFIDNQLDGTTGTIRFRAVLNNADGRLKPGLFANVRLAAGPPFDATLVEDRAVGTDQDKRYVYVVKRDSTVDYRPVQVGPLEDGLRVITSGVQPGDDVVVDGLQRVRPGAKVVAQLERPSADTGGSTKPLATTVGGSLAITRAVAAKAAPLTRSLRHSR